MRVLLVTDWPTFEGGVEAYVVWLRDALRAQGDEATILASGVGSAVGQAEHVVRGSNHRAVQAVLQLVNPFAVAGVRRAVRDTRADVVHVHAFAQHLSPAILRALTDRPVVLSVSDYKIVCPTNTKLLPDGTLCERPPGAICRQNGCVGALHWLRDRPRYDLIQRWPRRVQTIVSCSRWVQEVFSRHDCSSEHLPLPVRLPAGPFPRVPAPNPTFVYCGRLAREKGLDLLLRSFTRHRTAHPASRLRIVGDGPLRGSLADLASAPALRSVVTFTGWRAPDDVDRELTAAWALVAPSVHAEPLGLSVLEAITRGVPVVASAAGGHLESVAAGQTGLLFPNGDEAALTDCLNQIASGRAFPSKCVEPAARQDIERRHDPARHLERLREIYRSAQPPVTLESM